MHSDNRQCVFSFFLIATSIAIGVGPLYLLFVSPDSILETGRLQIDSFIAPIFIVGLFVISILYHRLGSYIYTSIKQFIPLLLLWLLLLFSSVLYSRNGANVSFNIPFLGAIFFYITCKGSMEDYPQTVKASLKAYVYTCGIVSLIYLLLIGSPFTLVSKGRYFFLGENPNSYSTRMAVSIICAIFFLEGNNLKQKIILGTLILSQSIVIFLSGSRGAVFMLVIGVVVYLFSSFKGGQKLRINFLLPIGLILMVGMILFGSLDFGEASMGARLLGFFESNDTGGRIELWKDSYAIFSDNPFIGVGSEGFIREMQLRFGENRDAHNLFLYLLTTGGIIGFLLFLYFLLPITFKAINQVKVQAYSITLIILMYFVAFKSGGVLSYSLLWYTLAIASALLNNRKKVSIE